MFYPKSTVEYFWLLKIQNYELYIKDIRMKVKLLL